jgi:hypothetical protein
MSYSKNSKVGRPRIRPFVSTAADQIAKTEADTAETVNRRKKAIARNKRPMPALHVLQLYRPGRLAQIFDVDESTIFRWRKSGVLPEFVEVGGIRGLTGVQVQAVLDGHKADEAA